jgi:hypothetical protein
VPPQALFLMNHPFVAECARDVLKRKDVAAPKESAERIDRLYRAVYGRPVREAELALAKEFLGPSDAKAWERYTHALLQANEFVFVD